MAERVLVTSGASGSGRALPDRGGTRAATAPSDQINPPEDVASAMSFLLDARSGIVTGQALHVCGGMTVGAAGA